MRTLIGHEYEVRLEDMDRGTLNGWFRAKFLTPHAKQMGWFWEIHDPRFTRMGLEEVHIVEVRKVQKCTNKDGQCGASWCNCHSNKSLSGPGVAGYAGGTGCAPRSVSDASEQTKENGQ